MTAFLDDPRVRDLLRQADAAERLVQRLNESGADPTGVREALEAVLRDLGRAVWQQARSEAKLPEPPLAPLEVDDERWYTEEVEISGRLFDPGDLAEVAADALSSGTHPTPTAQTHRLETLAAVERRLAEPGDVLAALGGAPRPPWAEQVASACARLGAPTLDETPAQLETEGAQLQWGAANLAEQLDGLPEAVRTVFVAVLACRARRVQLLMDDAIGVEVALRRLLQYRVQERLPMVVALSDAGRPERGAWIRDTLAWWALVAPEGT
jgi:hypothetical protein